jgi:1-phosphatidylinositol phosphodiesterase
MFRTLRLFSLIVIFSLLNVLPSISMNDDPQDLSRWMGRIPNNIKISELSVPGTHESCALRSEWGPTSYAKCQDLSLEEQLKIGIRFLDIRCGHFEKGLHVYHGVVDQKLSFKDVLNVCSSFLSTNSTECILMSVKEEDVDIPLFKKSHETNGNQTFEDAIRIAINPQLNGLFYLEKQIPKLGNVRGKIVLLRRFETHNNTQMGIDLRDWPYNTKGIKKTNDDRVVYSIQDVCEVNDNDKKYAFVKDHIDTSIKDNKNTLCINFTSGSSSPFGLNPREVAKGYLTSYTVLLAYPAQPIKIEGVNELLHENLPKKGSRIGIIAMDFCSQNLSQKIVNLNIFDTVEAIASLSSTGKIKAKSESLSVKHAKMKKSKKKHKKTKKDKK